MGELRERCWQTREKSLGSVSLLKTRPGRLPFPMLPEAGSSKGEDLWAVIGFSLEQPQRAGEGIQLRSPCAFILIYWRHWDQPQCCACKMPFSPCTPISQVCAKPWSQASQDTAGRDVLNRKRDLLQTRCLVCVLLSLTSQDDTESEPTAKGPHNPKAS